MIVNGWMTELIDWVLMVEVEWWNCGGCVVC